MIFKNNRLLHKNKQLLFYFLITYGFGVSDICNVWTKFKSTVKTLLLLL